MQMCPQCSTDNRDNAQFCIKCGGHLAGLLGSGTILQGRYRVTQVLGCGGMGAVYKAEDTQQGNAVCVLKELFDVTKVRQFYFVEANILRTLQHPQLPQVHEGFFDLKRHYLVMEFVDGHTLEQIMEENEKKGMLLQENVVFGWAIQLCDALVYLHGQPQSVIHRDIKPANLILTPHGEIKLVDFGIAKILDPGGRTTTGIRGIGSPGYAPIEQYSGGVGTDARSDVYGLGSTLYSLLTNKVPPEPTDRTSIPTLLVPPRQINPQITPRMEQVILRAMAVRPDQRYQTVQEMRRALLGKGVPTVPCPKCNAANPVGSQTCHVCGQVLILAGPFRFRSGDVAYSPAQLVPLCDRYWDEAKGYLYNQDFERWFKSLNRNDLVARAETIRKRGGDQSAGLEGLLHLLDLALLYPSLDVSTNSLHFGVLSGGQRSTLRFYISNPGRGCLQAELNPSAPWLNVKPEKLSCPPGQTIQVNAEVEVRGLPFRQTWNASIKVETPDGQREKVAVSVSVSPVRELAKQIRRLAPALLALALITALTVGVWSIGRAVENRRLQHAIEATAQVRRFVDTISRRIAFCVQTRGAMRIFTSWTSIATPSEGSPTILLAM